MLYVVVIVQVKVWNTTSGFCFVTFHEHTSGVTGVCLTSNGQVVLSASLDGTVRAFDLNRFVIYALNQYCFLTLFYNWANELKVFSESNNMTHLNLPLCSDIGILEHLHHLVLLSFPAWRLMPVLRLCVRAR